MKISGNKMPDSLDRAANTMVSTNDTVKNAIKNADGSITFSSASKTPLPTEMIDRNAKPKAPKYPISTDVKANPNAAQDIIGEWKLVDGETNGDDEVVYGMKLVLDNKDKITVRYFADKTFQNTDLDYNTINSGNPQAVRGHGHYAVAPDGKEITMKMDALLHVRMISEVTPTLLTIYLKNDYYTIKRVYKKIK